MSFCSLMFITFLSGVPIADVVLTIDTTKFRAVTTTITITVISHFVFGQVKYVHPYISILSFNCKFYLNLLADIK